MKARRLRRLILVALAIPGLVGILGTAPASAALQGDVQISGHGYGHGRGMSQWGARGYAVDHGWTATQILDHYYGGTRVGNVGNPDITVELLSYGGLDVALTAPVLNVNGATVPGGAPAVLVHRNPNGTFKVLRGNSCTGGWSGWLDGLASGVTIASAATADPSTHLQVCEAGQVRGFRGVIQAVNTGSSSAMVNRLPLNSYLMGVVPREMPASWADLGGGKGLQALRAQAVAARSYAWASQRNGYAKTCDTTACQVYGGEYVQRFGGARQVLEDPRSNTAISGTAGVVRFNGANQAVRTEFSSSTGGWTAGGVFPAVEDLGDGTAANPNHNWSLSIDVSTLAARLGTAAIVGLSVTQRNGLGADGGRVLQVTVETTGGTRTFTGAQFRSRVGLKSDWFSFDVRSYAQSASFTRALYNDLLGRAGAPSDVAAWAGSVAGGTDPASVGRAFITSTERLRATLGQVYSDALHRTPDANGYRTWVAYLQSGATYNDLNAAVYSSAESLQVLGGGDPRVWVDGLYQQLLGRGAGGAERQHWADVAAARGRSYVVWNISGSVEARQRRLNAYYLELLQRPVDGSGLGTWMPRLMQNGDVDVQVFITSSVEYWNRAQIRFP
jgi:SpoIID/LytB domain protein